MQTSHWTSRSPLPAQSQTNCDLPWSYSYKCLAQFRRSGKDFGNSRIINIDPKCTSEFISTLYYSCSWYCDLHASWGMFRSFQVQRKTWHLFLWSSSSLYSYTNIFPSSLLPVYDAENLTFRTEADTWLEISPKSITFFPVISPSYNTQSFIHSLTEPDFQTLALARLNYSMDTEG